MTNIVSAYTLAAYHSTAVHLTWFIFALSQHPEVLNKLRDEIDQNIKGNPKYNGL
jgi:cytochrome P450